MHGACDGARQAIRRRRADARDMHGTLVGVVEFEGATGQRKHRIAVVGSVRGTQRTRDAVLRHHGHAFAFHAGQIRVARNHTQSRVRDRRRQTPG